MDGRLLQASCKMCMFSEARIVRPATETRIHDAAFQTTVTELVSLINKLSALKIQSTASWVVSEISIRIRQYKVLEARQVCIQKYRMLTRQVIGQLPTDKESRR